MIQKKEYGIKTRINEIFTLNSCCLVLKTKWCIIISDILHKIFLVKNKVILDISYIYSPI